MKQSIFCTGFLILFLFQLIHGQNGNVGIGTDDPQAKLHVDGDVRIDDKIELKNISGATVFLIDPENGEMKLLNELGETVTVWKLINANNLGNGNPNSEINSGNQGEIIVGDPTSAVTKVNLSGVEIDDISGNAFLNSESLTVTNQSATIFDEKMEINHNTLLFQNGQGVVVGIQAHPEKKKLIVEGELCVDEIKLKNPGSNLETTVMPGLLKNVNNANGKKVEIKDNEVNVSNPVDGKSVNITPNIITLTDPLSNSSSSQSAAFQKFINGDTFSFFESGKSTLENTQKGEKNEQTANKNLITDTNNNENTSTSEKNRVEETSTGKYSQMDKNKVASGDNTKASLIDCIGFFNSKFSPNGTAGLSLDHAGLFNFDGNGSVGFSFDIPQESMDFFADIFVNGEISASVKNFRIDHPLDPYNKILQHVSVESPDMMNIYNGNIQTDANGKADVQLPEYFEALNMDFRYQLTVIGSFAQAIISKKVQNNRFEIQTNQPNVEVSWQVTGIRNDSYARERRVEVEVPKTVAEKGQLIFDPAKKRSLPKVIEANIEKRRDDLASTISSN